MSRLRRHSSRKRADLQNRVRNVEQAAVDLGKATDEELLEHQTQANDWFGRHARRLLHERAAAKTLAAGTVAAVGKRLAEEKTPRMKLRWMWLSHVLQGAVPASDLVKWAGDADEDVAAWAARLAVDHRSAPPSGEVVARLVELAGKTDSPFVRVHLASALQWLPDDARWALAEALATRQERRFERTDRADVVVRLGAVGAEGCGARDSPGCGDADFAVAGVCGPPFGADARDGEADRVGEFDRRSPRRGAGFDRQRRGAETRAVAGGLGRGLEESVGTGDAYLEDATLALSLQFGEAKAVEVLRTRAESKDLPAARRASAIRTLALLKDRGMVPVFVGLLADPEVGAAALAALSPFADGAIADSVVKHYGTWSAGDRRDAVSILASRGEWADKLLDAIAAGAIPKGDVSLTVARQLAGSKHPGVGAKLEKVWGKVRESAAERQALVAKYRSELPPAAVKAADLEKGQAIYKKTCGACHVLFGEGEKIGPS